MRMTAEVARGIWFRFHEAYCVCEGDPERCKYEMPEATRVGIPEGGEDAGGPAANHYAKAAGRSSSSRSPRPASRR